MSSIFKSLSGPSLFVALIAVAGCGGDEGGKGFTPDPDGGSGGKRDAGTGSGGEGEGDGGKGSGGKGSGGKGVGGKGSGGGANGGTDGGSTGGVDGGATGGTDGGTPTDGGCEGGDCGKPILTDCEEGAECASGNCVGGVCCAVACDSPGQCEKAENTVCLNGTTCQYGKQLDETDCDDDDGCTSKSSCFNGKCEPVTPLNCDDNDACNTDSCEDGVCVHVDLVPAVDCNDGNPCTNDSCNPLIGCRHSNKANNAVCDDNDSDPCTVDRCQTGVCVSTAKDCTTFDGDCTLGVCSGGDCSAEPRNANRACDEDLDACDKTRATRPAGATTPVPASAATTLAVSRRTSRAARPARAAPAA
jgi:hypothetical protein